MINIRPDEISNIIRQQIESYDQEVQIDNVGSVLQIGDGIASLFVLDTRRGHHGGSSGRIGFQGEGHGFGRIRTQRAHSCGARDAWPHGYTGGIWPFQAI